MSSADVYAPPKAAGSGMATGSDRQPQLFFPVSPTKLTVMFLATFGLYAIHWHERNWRLQQQATGEAMMPLARGLFAIFFAHKLMRLVHARACDLNLTPTWSAQTEATTYVALSVIGNVASRAYGLAGLLSFGCLVPMLNVQRSANQILRNDCKDLDMNERFTATNIVGLFVAGGLWLMAITGWTQGA